MDGSFGSDILSGGGGDDQLFGGLNTGVESDQLDGGEGNDVLVVITHRPITEHIPGNGGIARGGNGNDELRGGSNSELIGGFGADIYTSNVGGSSFVSYAGSAAVNVNLDTGVVWEAMPRATRSSDFFHAVSRVLWAAASTTR